MSESKTIGRAAAIVSVGILLSRVLGYGRTLILAALLGVSTDSDLYVAAFFIPDLLFFLMAGGYLSITLVPLLTDRLEAEGAEGARRAFTAVFRVVVGLMLGVTLILLVTAGPLTAAVFPKFSGVELDRLVAMMRVTFVSQVFFVAGTLLMASQYARRRFLIPTLAPLFYNLGIIGGGVVGAIAGDPTPEAFIWGGLVGAVIGNFGLQLVGSHRVGFGLTRSVPLRHPVIRDYFVLAFPLMIGQSAVALDEQWPRLFGQFAGEGGQSALYYARILNMLPVGVIAQAAGVAAFPFLAGLFSARKLGEMRETVLRSVRSAVAVGGLAMALMVAASLPIVRIAYQWGAFDTGDTDLVSRLLTIYALSIPFWAAHQVYTRAFYAQKRMWTPVLIGTAVTVVLVPLLFVGVDRYGAPGVAAMSTLGVAGYTIAIAIAWHRQGSPGEGRQLMRSLVRTAGASLAAAVTAGGLIALASEGGFNLLASSAVAGVLGALVYLGVGRLLNMSELDPLWNRIRAITSRR
jgi:putative peptidoglycan lipid II flippase